MRATDFIWRAAGSPAPFDAAGVPIEPKAPPGATCAGCGSAARYLLSQAISDSFTTVKNIARAWPHGGAHACAACVFCCRSVALRAGLWFARPDAIWWIGTWPLKGFPQTRPDALHALLNPPEPPFVAGYALAGIDHGGEDAIERTRLAPHAPDLLALAADITAATDAAAALLIAAAPALRPGTDEKLKPEDVKKIVRRALVVLDAAPWPSSLDWPAHVARFGRYRWEPWWRSAAWPMVKLQSKHVALYAKVSTSRERYHLQVDDSLDFVLDVPLWTSLRAIAEPLLVDMRSGGVGAQDARAALDTLIAPAFAPMALHAAWHRRVAPLSRYSGATWWRLFVSLLPMPALTVTPKEKTHAQHP